MQQTEITLKTDDNQRLSNICGQYNQNLQQIEKYLGVEIHNRGNLFQISGEANAIKKAKKVLQELFAITKNGKFLTIHDIHLTLQDMKSRATAGDEVENLEKIVIHTPKLNIVPRSKNQINYIKNILKDDINFSIGPAGTGKTYLAVACAVAALQEEQIDRIVLVRPVVEAGEHLGFLPGDIAQKIDPYLRPLYDALYDMLGARQVEKLLAERVIELAPLAFMRGRTLNSSFIILDESQNSTPEQMKMFLTRIGFASKAVITGDVTQIDLGKGKLSGLLEAKEILKNIAGISFNYFDAHDVVRHPLVQKIIQAYDKKNKS
jgi:phosphate starvation-inducible PhoH-like protein